MTNPHKRSLPVFLQTLDHHDTCPHSNWWHCDLCYSSTFPEEETTNQLSTR